VPRTSPPRLVVFEVGAQDVELEVARGQDDTVGIGEARLGRGERPHREFAHAQGAVEIGIQLGHPILRLRSQPKG
jgi:hypothetical protein